MKLKMSDIIRFGKHNGKSLEYIYKYERGYANWLLKEKPVSMPIHQYQQLEELHLEQLKSLETDNILSKAYYNTALYRELVKDVRTYINNKYPIISADIQFDNSIICEMIAGISDNKYYIDGINVEIPRLDIFDTKFEELRRLQKEQLESDKAEVRPSHKVCKFDINLNEFCDIHKNVPLSGKWMIYLNKIKEDEEGYTEIDRCWRIIVQNAPYIFTYGNKCFTANVSTRRHNPTSNSGIDIGVILLNCDDEYKHEMITRFRSLYTYNKEIYWKSDEATRNGVYAKYNMRASSDVSYP